MANWCTEDDVERLAGDLIVGDRWDHGLFELIQTVATELMMYTDPDGSYAFRDVPYRLVSKVCARVWHKERDERPIALINKRDGECADWCWVDNGVPVNWSEYPQKRK